jgi:hypothetical protein
MEAARSFELLVVVTFSTVPRHGQESRCPHFTPSLDAYYIILRHSANCSANLI